MNNLHISLTNLKNESRVLKETNTLISKKIFQKIFIVGLHEKDLKIDEYVDKDRSIHRMKLKSRKLPKTIMFQIFKYLEFMFRTLLKYRTYDIKVVNVHSLGLLPIGVLFKLFYRTKLIYDAHEYETETQGLRGIKKSFSKILEKVLILYCDRVTVVSESIADEYQKLYSKIERPFIVLNTPPYKKIEKKDIFRETLNISKDKTIFLYQGGLNSGRGIEILLDTFKNLHDENSVIVFMGYGPLKELVQTTSQQFTNIYFHKAVSPDVLLDYTSSADFGISTIEDSCLSYRYCLPNKMFEYLMAEVPVIASNLYEMKRLVEDNKIGVVAKENTPKGLGQAIKEAVQLDSEQLYENIQKVKKIYNWEEQERVLLRIYKDLDL